MNAPDICAISLEAMRAMLDTGEQIDIVKMFDGEGDETNDPDEAASFCAGPDAQGNWYAAKKGRVTH